MRTAILCAFLCSLFGCAGGSEPVAAQSRQKEAPRNLFPVKPITPEPAQSARSLTIGNGPYFFYALPPGWRVGEKRPVCPDPSRAG